jgi:hypothetical protein
MSYDTHCYELAELFLPDGTSEEVISKVAQEIQTFVEDVTREYNEAVERKPNEA